MNKKEMREIMKKVPIVKVSKSENGKQYVFWCAWCKKLHYHGAVEGIRGAHCRNENSPYKDIDYILKEYTKKELAEMGLSIKQ